MEMALIVAGISILFLLAVLTVCAVTRKNAMKYGVIAFHTAGGIGYQIILLICLGFALYRMWINYLDMWDYGMIAVNFTEDFFSYEVEQSKIRMVYDGAMLITILAIFMMNSGFVTQKGWYHFGGKRPHLIEVEEKNGEIQFLLQHNKRFLFSIEDKPEKRKKFAYFLKDEKEGIS